MQGHSKLFKGHCGQLYTYRMWYVGRSGGMLLQEILLNRIKLDTRRLLLHEAIFRLQISCVLQFLANRISIVAVHTCCRQHGLCHSAITELNVTAQTVHQNVHLDIQIPVPRYFLDLRLEIIFRPKYQCFDVL